MEDTNHQPVIMLVSNTGWYLFNFRRGLIQELLARRYRVVLVSPQDEYLPRLEEWGCETVAVPMDSKGSNPVRDFTLMMTLLSVYRRYRPQVILQNTIKPNIYGSMAARLLGIPVINTITGLGTAFLHDDLRQKIVRVLYRLSQGFASRIFFQNQEDMRSFVDAGLVSGKRVEHIPGSGVNLERFGLAPLPLGEPFSFLMIARVMRDKGVVEYVDAARLVKADYPEVTFRLLGFLDVDNHSAISASQVDQWEQEGCLVYLGKTDDVVPHIRQAHCVVLPSYREGLPKTLIEAAAVGRPLIATDAVGCRDVVIDGDNGYLCKVQDAADLARAMLRMIRLTDAERTLMGERGNSMAREKYDEKIVIAKYLRAMADAGVPVAGLT